jgi:hypothetical protein
MEAEEATPPPVQALGDQTAPKRQPFGAVFDTYIDVDA